MIQLNHAVVTAFLSLAATGAAHGAGFKPCDDAASHPALAGSLCAVEQAPADPSRMADGPSAPVSLFVRKFPATEVSRGQVWLIAGGPGESGASFYKLLPQVREAFPGFDLVMPDHRGTGYSTRMCPDEEAAASPGGMALAGAEWASCFRRLNEQPGYTRQFSETNAAYDLKLLVERMPHKGKTYLYGVSYGTQLVLRTLALGTARVDGVVLDSLVSMQDDDKADISSRSLVADAVGRQVLADCDASPACSRQMGAPAATVYRRLLDRAAAEPALFDSVPGKNPKLLFGNLLDIPDAAPQIPYLIKELEQGKGERMQAVIAQVEEQMESFGGFAQSPPSTPLVILITASENNLRPGRTAAEVEREEAGLLFTSSLPGHAVNTPLPLYKRDGWFATLPQRLPPTLVIHGDRDGKTPHDAAVRHIGALRAAGPVQLYTAAGKGHFVLWADRCARHEVRAFVLGKDDGKRCATLAGSR